MYLIPHPTLHACRTSTNLPKRHIRSLREEGLEIEYIETVHREDGDETTIVWSRPYHPSEIRYENIPY
jgi:hypothetical protein